MMISCIGTDILWLKDFIVRNYVLRLEPGERIAVGFPEEKESPGECEYTLEISLDAPICLVVNRLGQRLDFEFPRFIHPPAEGEKPHISILEADNHALRLLDCWRSLLIPRVNRELEAIKQLRGKDGAK